jgi:hypothetical protein
LMRVKIFLIISLSPTWVEFSLWRPHMRHIKSARGADPPFAREEGSMYDVFEMRVEVAWGEKCGGVSRGNLCPFVVA